MNRPQTFFIFSLSMVLLCPWAIAGDGVLKSSTSEGNDGTKSSTLVPAISSASSDAFSDAPKNSATGTAKLTFKSKSAAAAQTEAGEAGKDSETAKSGEAEEEVKIFRSSNPNATTPQGTSPFIKQVASNATPYRRMPVVSRGKAVPSSSTTPATVRRRSDTAQNVSP